MFFRCLFELKNREVDGGITHPPTKKLVKSGIFSKFPGTRKSDQTSNIQTSWISFYSQILSLILCQHKHGDELKVNVSRKVFVCPVTKTISPSTFLQEVTKIVHLGHLYSCPKNQLTLFRICHTCPFFFGGILIVLNITVRGLKFMAIH